jgi:hypothetical protein
MRTAGLTNPYSEEWSARIAETPAGMAHWRGSGPDGKFCKDCREMFRSDDEVRREGGGIRSRRCQKFSRLMGAGGRAIPAMTPACIYFETNDLEIPAQTERQAKKQESLEL